LRAFAAAEGSRSSTNHQRGILMVILQAEHAVSPRRAAFGLARLRSASLR
jgi:hypothetical protein